MQSAVYQSDSVKKVIIQKINIIKQGTGGTKWEPSKGLVIFIVHYLVFKGSSRGNKDLVPVHLRDLATILLLLHQRKEN